MTAPSGARVLSGTYPSTLVGGQRALQRAHPPASAGGGLGHAEALGRKTERGRAIMRGYASGKGFQPYPRSKQGSAMVP